MALADVIERWSDRQPERCALRFAGHETSWRRFWNRIERASARLACEWNVASGDRVAYLGYNRPEQLILLFALARLGAIYVPLNCRLLETQWGDLVRDAGARHLLYDSGFDESARNLAKAANLKVFDADALIAKPCPHRFSADPVSGSTPVLLVYTSGTTGEPKGVLHSQEGLLWNAAASIEAHALVSDDHILTVLPLFHVGGLCIQTLPALVAGAQVTLHARFDAARWLEEVEASRPSLSLMVPATLRAVIEHPRFGGADLSSLRALMAGSSTIPMTFLNAFHERGVPVGQIYGATETGPVSIVLKPEDAFRKAGKAGWAALHCEIRLRAADEPDLPIGEIGEIRVRARNLALGYWEDFAAAPFPDGWFRTGDLAFRDEEGCFEVVGRAGEMIISGGEHIHPAELEGILCEHPDVADAAVVGIADRLWGETPVAAVVLRAGAVSDAAAILAVFEGRIARYKHPRLVWFFDVLPRNVMGKVQKSELVASRRPPMPGSDDSI